MRIYLFFAVSAFALAQGSSYRWVKQIAGSGSDVAIGMAMDGAGNTYIAGNTLSRDFPVSNALQTHPGGAPLYKVDAATTAVTPLRNAGIDSVAAVAIDPQDPRVFYALTNSKLVRSTDSGATWTSFAAPPNTNSAYSIDVAYDGTSHLVYITADDVIYASTDLTNWKPISAGVTKGRIYAVVADPGNPSRLFARTSDGLAWTEDAGATWTQSGVYVFDVSFDPFSSGTMYAGGLTPLVSHDSGKTWTPLGALTRDDYPQTVLRDPLHPGFLYAFSYNGYYVSTDSGQTWQQATHSIIYPAMVDRITGSIYATTGSRIVMTRDGFNTSTPLGPPAYAVVSSFRAVGGTVLIGAFSSRDVFVTKLDPDGNIVYSTYVGGSADDAATAMTVDGGGALYVTGSTVSQDFPVTAGAYSTTLANPGASFLFKLNPDGTLAYSTLFGQGATNAVAVDSSGSAYIAGTTSGGLPTTPGAYQTELNGIYAVCGIFCGFLATPTNAFVTKFAPNGSRLIYSTYVGKQSDSGTVLAVAPDGSSYVGGQQHFFKLSPDASSLLATVTPAFQPAQFISDASGNLYVAGSAARTQPQTGAVHSFVTTVTPPSLPNGTAYGGRVAIVAKFAPDLTQIASALVGGERYDAASSVSLDGSGNVLLAGMATSKMFPTRAPVQSLFASQTGFVAQLSADLSTLSFASYEGNNQAFSILNALTAKDGSLVFGGSTLSAYAGPVDGPYYPPAAPGPPPHVFVAKLAVQVPSPRLDMVVNAASFAALPLAANEAIVLRGDGFGANPQVLVDGQPVAVLSSSAQSILAVMPADFKSDGASQVAVSSGGVLTNPILMPNKPSAPGIFSVDGSGVGQGYILNADGTPNSPSNPAATGSIITIFATGPGPVTMAGPYAVTQVVPAVFIDGFYANGVDARLGPVPGLPGDVYQLRVTIPDPSQFAPNAFGLPPQVSVQMLIGDVYSQQGIALWVK